MADVRTRGARSARTPAPLIVAAALAILGCTAAHAADDGGRFAIKGAGLQTCGAFLTAVDSGSRDIAIYAGWIEGYVTGLNQFTADAYDLTPWQSAQSMLGLVQSVCRAGAAETPFIDALTQVLRLLAPQRLRTESPVDAVQWQGRGAVVYRAVVAAAQARLAALGLFAGVADGLWNAATAEALGAFQRREGLEETGLPDQRTLFDLLVSAR